ncbi:MAG: molybdopterin-dependent oxidoreductase, partial [Dehalococcoidia bacterium]
TDGAFIIAIINVLVNELGVYDAEFLEERTNAAYLVRPDGHYVKQGSKPLVWDAVEDVVKPFDAEVKDYALDGSYKVDGVECRPAFHYVKEAVREYSPEKVAEITTIPAETIRRIAREFGEAACIGSTINIDGQELRYRPVAVNIYRGAGAHNHGVVNALAVQTLNMIVGAFYSVGGHRGTNLLGPGNSWAPLTSDEGLIKPHSSQGEGAEYYDFDVRPPQTLWLGELMPISTNRSTFNELGIRDPERFKLPYTAEMLIVCRRNLIMSSASSEHAAEMLKKIPFVVYFSLHQDELSDFADILLPEQHGLEKLILYCDIGGMAISALTGYWYWSLKQPVVKPPGEARHWIEVLLELAYRTGFLDEVNPLINVEFQLKDPYKLDPKKKYSLAEIFDRQAKSLFGPEFGLDWFKEHGSYKAKRSVAGRYPGQFIAPRFPIYFENMLRARDDVKGVTDELGLEWDTSDYSPTLYWKPCEAFSKDVQDEFYAVNFKIPLHTFTHTIENPWLNELGGIHPYAYKILMSSEPAQKRGIRDGDTIRLESEAGSVTGT